LLQSQLVSRFALLRPQTQWRNDTAAADLAAVAPASVEAALTVVDSTVVGSTGAGFVVAGLALASMGATLPAAVFVAIVASAAIGFAIVISTTSFSSEIFGTRSFTIRIHITVTILTDIIPMVTDMILTIYLFTKAERDIPILWSVRSSFAWLVQAIIVAPSMA
jgi:hypothetical protein